MEGPRCVLDGVKLSDDVRNAVNGGVAENESTLGVGVATDAATPTIRLQMIPIVRQVQGPVHVAKKGSNITRLIHR